jgi:probable phosphoglycerate mutase
MERPLYILRHGETLFNVQHKTQGFCDSPLTERGVEQCRIAGRMLKARGLAFDGLFCSTSERCSDTLELALEAGWGECPPYVRMKGLKEMNFGAFEAKDQFLERFPHGDFYQAYGGESQDEALARYVAALGACMTAGHDTTLVVSHGGVNAMLFHATVEHPAPGTVAFGNCICYHYEYDDGREGMGCFRWVETLVPDLSSLDAPGLPPQVSWR